MIRTLFQKSRPAIDKAMMPFTYLASTWLGYIRKYGIDRWPASKKVFEHVGVFPIRDHYYEPLFNPKHLDLNKWEKRELPGINLNVEKQLELLSTFRYQQELLSFPQEQTNKLEYTFANPSFFAGDAEILYNMIRHYKPQRIIEVGSGNSTLMMLNALKANQQENQAYTCNLQCIEPYEVHWLEQLNGVEVIRKKVQEVKLDFFKQLSENDILFIDSSHIIRPQGDVVYEFLEILPNLKPGVIIHIHDIFTPRDYLPENFNKHVLFMNEQYLMEALLCMNKGFEILSAVNYLKHDHFNLIAEVCPVLAMQPDKEPRSFWLRTISNE